MAFTPLRWIGTGFKYLWNALDFSRRVFFNLLILAILIIIIVNILSSGVKKIEHKTALILNLKGTLVEQHDSSPRETLLAEARGDTKRTTQLRDVLAVLDQAAKDPQISSAVLLLDEMGGAGLASLREVTTAIDRF
ncbi:MAG: signal peptide peptidase SppA, partial [Burkholderiales bacterium]|nr:signal peptide peptidase SppA [Burkholderiales bacterium]